MRKQSIEILKNFSEYSNRDIIEALTDSGIIAPRQFRIYDNSDFVFAMVRKTDGSYSQLHINKLDAKVYLLRHSKEGNTLLTKYFKHPLVPTEEERVLFEIEFGFSYPVNLDRTLIKLIKD